MMSRIAGSKKEAISSLRCGLSLQTQQCTEKGKVYKHCQFLLPISNPKLEIPVGWLAKFDPRIARPFEPLLRGLIELSSDRLYM